MSEEKFESAGGLQIFFRSWRPEGPARGVVAIVHGVNSHPPLLTPLNALYHAAITVKDLPPRERAAWRALFDFYIFQDHGDPAEHLPEAARGILGRRTPELVARVKAILARALGR